MLTDINPKLPMRNKAITKDYYLNKLGFQEFGNRDFNDYLMVQKDQIQIHFFEFKDLNPKENYGQVYIRTDNIDEYYQSLLDKKRLSVNVQQNVSVLSEIAIYTLSEEVPLKNVFEKIKEKEKGQQTSVKAKDSKDKLEEYFFEILPDYDEDRVYVSDIKKVIQWYNLLQEHNMLDSDDSKVKKVKSKGEEE